MGSRKRQDLLNKLGAWGPCGRAEVGRGEARGSREKFRALLKLLNKQNKTNIMTSRNLHANGWKKYPE